MYILIYDVYIIIIIYIIYISLYSIYNINNYYICRLSFLSVFGYGPPPGAYRNRVRMSLLRAVFVIIRGATHFGCLAEGPTGSTNFPPWCRTRDLA